MIVTGDPLKGRTLWSPPAPDPGTIAIGPGGPRGRGAPFRDRGARCQTRSARHDHRALGDYDWIVFTSANGVAFFVRRARELPGIRPPDRLPRVCAIGPGTAAAAAAAGFPPDLVPEEFVAEGVFEALVRRCGGAPGLRGKRILLPRAEHAREFLPEALARAGARVDVVPCYRTERGAVPAAILDRVREKRPDLLVFTSASTIRNMIETLGQDEGGVVV